jgi:hypothetical protein
MVICFSENNWFMENNLRKTLTANGSWHMALPPVNPCRIIRNWIFKLKWINLYNHLSQWENSLESSNFDVVTLIIPIRNNYFWWKQR